MRGNSDARSKDCMQRNVVRGIFLYFRLFVNKVTFLLLFNYGPVHTNPFSNENGAVLLRFQNDLRPHLSFSPVHTTTPYPFFDVLKTLLYPQCACSNELDACVTHVHFNISAREIGAKS